MLRSPLHILKPSVATLALRSASAVLMGLGLAAAQDFGTVPSNFPPDIADQGTKVQAVMRQAPGGGRNLGYSEGPVADLEGTLYFTEDNGLGNIWKVTAAGVATNFYNGPGMPNGLEFDNSGKMFSAEKGTVATYDVKVGGSSRATLSMNPALNAEYRINDVSIGSNGGVWFTNHANGNQYFYRDPSGKVTPYNLKDANNVTLPTGVAVPNGIEWIEEKKLLLVCSSGDNKVYQFNLDTDLKPSNKKAFGDVPVPDGITVDAEGNVYVASYGTGKVYVFGSAGGTEKGIIDVKTGGPKNISNCTFGGPGNKTLFMTGTQGAYKIQLKIAGRTRPGTVGIRTGALRLRTAPRSFSEGYTLAGRKVDLTSGVSAALKIMAAPVVR